MRIFSYDVLENTENAEDHHLLLMMKTKMRKLHQGHPHQRSNLSRVQMRTDYPSNLKVINRYDSSSLSIKGPNPTDLTL